MILQHYVTSKYPRSDCNMNMQVALFLDYVNREGVRPEEFEKLEQQATDDHELTLTEFLAWLVAATSADEHKEAEVQTRYEMHASTGRRRSTVMNKKVCMFLKALCLPQNYI